MKNKPVGMEFAVEVVQTVLMTGQFVYEKNEKPVSLLLIASPESGKTTVARKAEYFGDQELEDRHGDELTVTLTDATGNGLLKIIREHPKATHITFNDLSIVTGHKSQVTNHLFNMISALTEEGIDKTADPGGIHLYGEEGLKGVIACITPELVRDKRLIWNRTGLTTRMLPFFYEQGLSIRLKAEKYHAGLKDYSTSAAVSTLRLPKKKMHVAISTSRREQIMELAKDLAKKLSREGRTKSNPLYEELWIPA